MTANETLSTFATGHNHTQDHYESIVAIGNDAGHSLDFMWASNGGHLAMAIINWVMVWGKYFFYLYFGIGWTRLLALFTAFASMNML